MSTMIHEQVAWQLLRWYLITPRMIIAHIVCRGVGERTERFQRRGLIYGHLIQHPCYVLADVHVRLGAVLNKLMLLHTSHTHTHTYICFPVFRCGNRSPSATNVVVLLGVDVSTKAFFISQPINVKHHIQIGDNISYNCTTSDFHVKS